MVGRIISIATALLTSSLGFAEWSAVSVPGEQRFEGYAWYRAWFKPHRTFFNKHERDLYAESVVVNIRSLAGAHEVYVNGTKIGSGGAFPPGFEDGVDGNHRHKIPSGTLVQDAWNEVAVRVYQEDGSGGFLSEAPFVMNYFQELVFEGNWEFQEGDGDFVPGGAVTEEPGSAAFASFHESSRVLGEAETSVRGESLPPEVSLAKMETAEDLEVDLMLSEPLVAQPTHFSFDSRGRLWVAQYRQYPYPAGLKMISRDRYYRSHYDRVPPAPPNHDRGRDIVSIHEDTDGDGAYDKHKVFLDGLNMSNAAIRGRGGVWVMHTPYLLFYPDRDFDDIPDGPPEVRLEGFGMEDTHSVANGLVWGMDGWLYGAQGSTATCHVRRPGIDSPDTDGVYYQGSMVWRYHPESRRFEIFAEGGGNNFGLEVDAGGRLFTGNNGGGTRGWHFMQGGMHLMQNVARNKFGPPRNPFAFGHLPKMESEQEIRRFTHFATLVESTALPERYHGSFFAIDPLHNFVIASKRVPVGATFRTTDIGMALTSDDFAFRPVFIGNAPDGSILVADFYEHYIAHGQHYQSQIDNTTGRIFRVRGKSEPLETDLDLHSKSSAELLELLGHPNKWHRHTAVRILGERKDERVAGPLRKLVVDGADLESLNALWALHQAFGIDEATAIRALEHAYAPVRYWAVRLVCDDFGFANKRITLGLVDSLGEPESEQDRVSEAVFSAIQERARVEMDAEARSQIAGSARRLPSAQALPLVRELLGRDEDLEDLYVPLLCWWVLETHIDRSRDEIMAMLEDGDFRRNPMVVTHILPRVMRALALKGRNRDLQDCARLLALADTAEQTNSLMEGFEQAYAGRRVSGLPDELARALVESGRSSIELRLRLGELAAAAEAIERLLDDDADLGDRIAVARTLGEVRPEGSVEALMEVSTIPDSLPLQRAALAALSAFDNPSIGAAVLQRFSRYAEEARPALFDLLLSRTEWTRQLAARIADDSISRDSITKEVADRLRRNPDPEISGIADRVLGSDSDIDQANTRLRIQELTSTIVEGPGDPYTGEAIYGQRCAACHTLFHKGGNIGPDLTPYHRGDLETMLLSIIDPNTEIREGFEYVTLETTDGRTLNGFVVDEDTQIVALRGMGGEDLRVERAHVVSIEPVGRSLMPEGLLSGLSEQELRDFFAYLRISQPISE